jgi:murein L,D-transpeptidase YafK
MIGRRGVTRALLSLLGGSGILAASPARYRIEVRKGERQLALFTDGKLTHTFRIGLGFAPIGHKAQQGDGRTPEGTYRTVLKNPRSSFHRSVMLNYPLPADAHRGFAGGLINAATRDAILAAHRRGTAPPQRTRLGGEIFLHGGGNHGDWTLGCIALANPDMNLLFALPLGVRVDILP